MDTVILYEELLSLAGRKGTDDNSVFTFLNDHASDLKFISDSSVQTLFVMFAENAKYGAVSRWLDFGFRMNLDSMTIVFSCIVKDNDQAAFTLLEKLHDLQKLTMAEMFERSYDQFFTLTLGVEDEEKLAFLWNRRPLHVSYYKSFFEVLFERDSFDMFFGMLKRVDKAVSSSVVNYLVGRTFESSRLKYLNEFLGLGLTPYRIPMEKRREILKEARAKSYEHIITILSKILDIKK